MSANTISLKELRKEAKKSKLKVGDKVAFVPMGGIWAELRWLSGTIIKKNKDPMWMFDVQIDYPHLLYPEANHLKGDEFVTCVGPSAVVNIRDIDKGVLSKLNHNLGLFGIHTNLSLAMSRLVALRLLWKQILKMDKKWGTKKTIEVSQRKIKAFTKEIEKFRKVGFLVPPEYDVLTNK